MDIQELRELYLEQQRTIDNLNSLNQVISLELKRLGNDYAGLEKIVVRGNGQESLMQNLSRSQERIASVSKNLDDKYQSLYEKLESLEDDFNKLTNKLTEIQMRLDALVVKSASAIKEESPYLELATNPKLWAALIAGGLLAFGTVFGVRFEGGGSGEPPAQIESPSEK